MEYINYNDIVFAQQANLEIVFVVKPFLYNDGRKPRLPRNSSKRYQLRKDVKFIFNKIFETIDRTADLNKYKVELTIHCGHDRLGGADLDNYCKAILDGITNTQKVWVDDRQVDELEIKRKYNLESSSFIEGKIRAI